MIVSCEYSKTHDRDYWLRVIKDAISWIYESNDVDECDFAYDFAKYVLYEFSDSCRTHIKSNGGVKPNEK